MDIATCLRGVPFFSGLSEPDVVLLAQVGWHRTEDANYTLFHEGDRGDSLYIILQGAVKLFWCDEKEQEIEVAILKEGDFFGEFALFDAGSRSASARTLEASVFFLLQRDAFMKILGEKPAMLSAVLTGLADKIRRSNQNFFDLALQKERLRVRAEIERHRSIAQMVAGVAHEINTPLGIVNHAASIFVETLRPNALDRMARDQAARSELEDLLEAAHLIQNNIARANHLIESFKKLSVRQVTERRETVNIVTLTREIVDLYCLKARDARLTLEVIDHLGNTAPSWDTYPGHYSQILLNLLANADRYAYPEGAEGRIDIILTRSDRLIVEVRDYGRGMPESARARVFEPFFTTGAAQGGSGLGMAIVYNLATSALAGDIRVDSAPDQGTRIVMQFPWRLPETSSV